MFDPSESAALERLSAPAVRNQEYDEAGFDTSRFVYFLHQARSAQALSAQALGCTQALHLREARNVMKLAF